MNDREPDSVAEDKAAIRTRMDALAKELTANGLPATMHVTYGVFDISVTLHQPGQKDINIVIDEDGYTELRYWADSPACPEQTVTVVCHALAAVTGTASGQSQRTSPH